ncbi:MAG: hypothetical protein IPG50_01185 [Myxococcales bacterium]|nr:hypothetical protein [Myxococcales bacterium]
MSPNRTPWLMTAATVLVGSLAALHLAAFARAVPSQDFLGDVVYQEALAKSLARGALFDDWLAGEAFGRASTVQRGSVLLFLPSALLQGAGLSSLVAAKAWFLALYVAAAALFFRLARALGASTGAAALGAALYAVAPSHLLSFAVAGHWQLAVSFALQPLVLLLSFRLVEACAAGAPTSRLVAGLALALSWGVLSDNERTACLLPVLAAAVGVAVAPRGARAGWAAVGALALAGVWAFGIAAAGAVPLLLEQGALALLRNTFLFPSHATGEFSHPLYLLDGGGVLYAGGEPRPAGATGLRESFFLVGVAAGAAAWRFDLAGARASAAAERSAESSLRTHGPALLAGALVALWLATPRPGWLLASFRLFPASEAKSLCGGVLLSGAALAVLLAATRSKPLRVKLAVAGLALFFLLVPSGAVVAHLPVLSHVANTRWYWHVAGPLLLAVVAALAFDALRGLTISRLVAAATLCLLVALFVVDQLAYKHPQSRVQDGALERGQATARALDNDPRSGRYLPYPHVESFAELAFALREARRPSASSWLLWAASRPAVERLAADYRLLQDAMAVRVDAPDAREAAQRALERLAVDDVRYLVSTQGSDLERLVGWGLVARAPGDGARVFRNLLHDGARFATSGGAAVAFERVVAERITVAAPPQGPLRVVEGFSRHWGADVDGAPAAVREEGGFLVVDVPPGARRLELAYARPRYEAWLLGASLALAMGALVTATGRVTLRRRATRRRA